MSKGLTKKEPVQKDLLWIAKNGVNKQVEKALVQNDFVNYGTTDVDRALALLDEQSYKFIVYESKAPAITHYQELVYLQREDVR